MLRRFGVVIVVSLVGAVLAPAPDSGPPSRESLPVSGRSVDVAAGIVTCIAIPTPAEAEAGSPRTHCRAAAPDLMVRDGFTIPEC